MISAVINTLDEETNLPYALRSLHPWVDEIVLVDMASTDRTVAIAQEFGARVFPHPRTGFVEPARAFGCARARGDWLFVLDADEVASAPLAERLQAVAATGAADVVRIPRRHYLLGGPLPHSGWNPERDRPPRFFRRDAVTFPERIHAPFEPRTGARVLDLDPEHAIVHFNYVDVGQFLERLNRYTTVEARQAFARGERAGPARSLRRAGREWATRYLWHGGWRDGWRGFYLSLCMAFYQVAVEAKLTEMEKVGTASEVRRRYRDEAERLIGSHSATLAGRAR